MLCLGIILPGLALWSGENFDLIQCDFWFSQEEVGKRNKRLNREPSEEKLQSSRKALVPHPGMDDI